MKALLRRWVRRFTRWAWEPDLTTGRDAREQLLGARRFAQARHLQLSILEQLFREKQAKIKRLQDAYRTKRAPTYEDLRMENPIKDAESLIASIDVMQERAMRVYERTGFRPPHSDGTVLGVPGDGPDVPAGEGWA